MEFKPNDETDLRRTVDELRREVMRLSERLAAFEKAGGASPAKADPTIETATPPFDAETLAVISAAIAAYLGEKPHIRQIRLLRSDAWSQHGRVTIQASHSLTVRR